MTNSKIYKIVEEYRDDPRMRSMRMSHATSIHIALIVYKGKILAEATNKIGTRSRGCGYSECSIHAERNVVKSLGDYTKLKDADMCVIRCGRGENSHNFANSKPCSDCECFLNKCIRKYGLRKIYYTC